MIERLSPFFPAIVVFIGALFVAGGGFWASLRQSNFNAEIRKKNEEIARLQADSAKTITGGDSFAYVQFHIAALNGDPVNAHSMPDDLLLVPVVIHQGQYPLYDMAARFSELKQGKLADIGSQLNSYPIGNMSTGAMLTNIRLPHRGKNIDFNIFFSARNGMWIQFLRMRWKGDGWATANKVLRGPQEIFREVSENFPRREDGSVDWGETGAQDKVQK